MIQSCSWSHRGRTPFVGRVCGLDHLSFSSELQRLVSDHGLLSQRHFTFWKPCGLKIFPILSSRSRGTRGLHQPHQPFDTGLTKGCFIVTLYYMKQFPIVYALRDSTVESGKTTEEQVAIQLNSVQEWKKKSVRLRNVLGELFYACTRSAHLRIDVCSLWFNFFPFVTLSFCYRTHSPSTEITSM